MRAEEHGRQDQVPRKGKPIDQPAHAAIGEAERRALLIPPLRSARRPEPADPRGYRLRERARGTPPGPAARDETACNSDDSTADGIEGNHTRQHERQDDGGSATLPVALGAYEHDFRDAEEKLRR